MKLLWGPHTCAIGIHVLLEEIGKPYELEQFDVAGGATHDTPFTDINPKGKVPTLIRDDGSVLTEFGAIATWLARMNPDMRLLPEEPEPEARAFEIMDYVVGTVHAQGFGRLFMPARFAPPEVPRHSLDAVRQQGRVMVQQGFGILNAALSDRSFAAGHAFSVADAALFYAERWAPQEDIPLPTHVQAHYQQMLGRPAVARVRQMWGEAQG